MLIFSRLIASSDPYPLEGSLDAIVILVAVAVGAVSWLCADYTKVTTSTVVVTGKDRGGSDGSYRIYTDSGTLAVMDIYMSIGNQRFNSADVYGKIIPCHRYLLAVRGWRFGPTSDMPNIVRIDKDLGRVDGCEPTTN